MKKTILIILCIFMTHIIYAQLQTGFHYVINNKKTIKYALDSLHPTTKTIARTRYKKIFHKQFLKANITQDKAKLKIEFWSISNESSSLTGSSTYINSQDSVNKFYIEIPKRNVLSDVNSFISIPYTTWELGVTTIPFKYRFGSKKDTIPNETTTSINAGLYIGKKWGRTRYFIGKDPSNTIAFTTAFFISPTAIALTQDNTRPKISTKSINELGISPGFAFMFSRQDINIGFLVGKDFAITGQSKSWFYADKLWIGFGIGYKLAILNGGK